MGFETPVTLEPGLGFAFYLTSGIVIMVNMLKAGFYRWGRPKRLRTTVPPWSWIIVGAVISVGMCVILKVNFVESVLGADQPFTGFMGYVASGIALAISSNVVYKVAVKNPTQVKTEKAVTAAVEEADRPGSVVAEPTTPNPGSVFAGAVVVEPLPELIPKSEPRHYRARLLADWKKDLGEPGYILLIAPDGQQRVVSLERIGPSSV